jgi:hypothetical protein
MMMMPVSGLKRAEIDQGHLLVLSTVHSRLEACQTQGAVELEEELRARIPHQAVPRQVKIGLEVKLFHWIRILGVGREYDDAVLLTQDTAYDIIHNIII